MGKEKSTRTLHTELRNSYLSALTEFFKSRNDEILVTGSNEIAIPCTDSENNDEFIVISVKVPTGDRDGTPYDGYGVAQDYAMKCAEKAEKAKASAEKKAKKIAADEKARAEKAAAKAAAKAAKETESGE